MRSVTEPKMFVFLGPDIFITYTPGEGDSQSELRFRGSLPESLQPHTRPPLDVTFSGEQVRRVQTELGALVTVDLEFVPDLRSLAMTVLLPEINLGGAEEIDFASGAIFTSHLTSIGGPALVEGQLETYVFVSLVCTARQSWHVGNSPQVARLYVKKRYADLAAIGQLTTISNPVGGEILPGIDLFYFSVGGKHPIVTQPHARHTLLVDAARGEVVLDLDTDPETQSDQELRLAVRDILPGVTTESAAKAAQVIAVIVPLDPYFANPTEGGFTVTPGQDGQILAVWSGDSFRYGLEFGADGRLLELKREDARVKPVCREHRARAQKFLDARHSELRAGDVVWDDLTAQLVPGHYIYEVGKANGKRAGLVAVEKGLGQVSFVSCSDRPALLTLSRQILEPADSPQAAADTAQVILTLLARAGAIQHAPMGPAYFTVSSPEIGFNAYSVELSATLEFDGTGRLACADGQSVLAST